MDEPEWVQIEVAYAAPSHQWLRALRVRPGTSVRAAIEASRIGEEIPELVIADDRLGIFSQKVGPEQAVKPGDRIEIYRPLRLDPMEARRKRARTDGSGA